MRPAAIVVAAALLCACSPRYDWRELRPDGLGCTVMLPGKPVSASRSIDLDGVPVTMTMHGARVDDVTFTVAMARLPDDEQGTRERALSAMRRGMLRNIGAGEVAPRDAEVAVVDAGGAKVGAVPAQRVDARGGAGGRPVRMIAGFAARGARAWQWTVIGESIDEDEARTFVESFRIAAEVGR